MRPETYRAVALTLAMVLGLDEIGPLAVTLLRRERFPEPRASMVRAGRSSAKSWRF